MIEARQSPSVANTNQSKATPEPREMAANSSQEHCIPISVITAAWHVQRLFEVCPHECNQIAQRAIELRRAGICVSIAGLYEWYRIEFGGLDMRKANNDPFKLNNTLRPAFARALMRDYPELKGKFETRKSVSDEVKQ